MNYKPFDVCLMNPPYGVAGDTTMHLKFADKCISLTKTQVAVFPFTFVNQPATKQTIQYKEHFNKYLVDVEEVDSTLFNGTAMTNVGIYKFVDNKGSRPVKITLINKHTYDIDDLTQPSRFNEYEKNIISLLDNKGNIDATVAGFHNHCTLTSLAKKGIEDEAQAWKIIDKNIEDNCKTLKENKYILSLAETSFDGYSFFNNETGDIFDSKADVIRHMQKRGRHTTRGFIFMMFETRKEAENLRDALKRPLLRFTLYRTKYSRLISTKTNYKYIPDIDWADDRTKTDEGILMMCGCPKEKAAEYAAYCKKIIYEVDKK